MLLMKVMAETGPHVALPMPFMAPSTHVDGLGTVGDDLWPVGPSSVTAAVSANAKTNNANITLGTINRYFKAIAVQIMLRWQSNAS